MSTAQDEASAVLDKLPDDRSLEDIQYHLCVVEKIHQGIRRAQTEGTISQDEAERAFDRSTAQ